MSTIPLRDIVNVTPGVLAAGGSAVLLNALVLTTSPRAPIGSVQSFANPAAVASYFGASSREKAIADVYFAGFTDSSVTPGRLLMAQYPTASVAAFLRGGNISATSLTALQAMSGTLSVTVNGVVKTGTPNLSGATSFSDAGRIIGAAIGAVGAQTASFTGAISGTDLTVSAVASGALNVGDNVAGAGVTAGTTITALGSGTGGTGTYTVSASQTVASEAMTATAQAVTYDSVSGAFQVNSPTTGAGSTIGFASGSLASQILLTSTTGAVTSQGAVAATPAAFMDALILVSQSFASFMTAFDPDNGSGNAQKYAFAQWNGTKGNRFAYVCWDNDAAPAASPAAAGSLGALIASASISGTLLVWEPTNQYLAAFACSIPASLNFGEREGRKTWKFRSQSGLVPGVTDENTATNLAANGYNFYGAYGPANPDFTFFVNGVISGPFQWADSYYNQIWMNGSFVNALVLLLTTAGTIPYNAAGRTKIEAALADVIAQAQTFGAIRTGVTLSQLQRTQVNAVAGRDVATTIQNRGWYLVVGDASSSVRQSRGSPPCTFFYMDGQSVQTINLSSIELQ